jgi:hypothetical protein
LPIHPWESNAMTVFRHMSNLERTPVGWRAFAAEFKVVSNAPSVFELDDITDAQLERTMLEIESIDARLPRYSEKASRWVSSVAHFAEETDWGLNEPKYQVENLRGIILGGSPCSKADLRLLRFWDRQYKKWTGEEGPLCDAAVAALTERPKRLWARLRRLTPAIGRIVLFVWSLHEYVLRPGGPAMKRAVKRFKTDGYSSEYIRCVASGLE